MSSNPRDDVPAQPVPGPPVAVEPARPRPHVRRLALRTKLIGLFIVGIVAVSLAIGGVTQALLTRYLTAQLDRQVEAASIRLSGPPPVGLQPLVPRTAPDGLPVMDSPCTTYATGPGARQPDDSVFAIYDVVTGQMSAAVRGTYPSCTVLDADRAGALTSVATDGRISTVSLDEFGSFRVDAQRAGDTVLISGLSTATIDATRRQLLLILGVVIGTAVVIGGAAVWWSVRRSLAPLEQVAATARQATALPLHEAGLAVRVPSSLTDTRTEAGTVGAALNQLFRHVDQSLAARKESERRLRQFIADASHELRTPLTAIRGYAELAGHHPDDTDGVRHSLARVRSESERMSTLVDDLLLLARLDSGRPLDVAPVDLTALVVETVADMRVAAPGHRWTVTVPDEPVLASGDAARLHQVLANLLTNARVHTPAGTTVTVEVAREGDDVMLSVADDGPGIPVDLQQSVFGRFVRADTSRSRGSGSTGLGLAIVASLVQAQHGTVSLDSKPGRTVFTLHVPAA